MHFLMHPRILLLHLLLLPDNLNPIPLDIPHHHQLCRHFEWITDSTVTRLSSSSSQFPDCVNVKVYPVPNSAHLYATLSISNRFACSNFKVEAAVLTLVALPNPTNFYDKAVPTGIWSLIPSGIKTNKLPSRFPTTYLQNTNKLNTPTCSQPNEVEDELPFFMESQPKTNTLVYRGLLKQGSGIAAQANVTIASNSPTPFQLSAELLLRIEPTGTAKYWIYDGSSRELVYYPNLNMIKFATNPTGKMFSIDPIYYSDSIGSRRINRQTVQRNTHMCSCHNPTRDSGSFPFDPLIPIPEIDAASIYQPCFEFKITNCPFSLTNEKLGAILIQKHCPAEPNLKLEDITFIAINEKGYPYGELQVNILIRPCYMDINGATGVTSVKPVIHDQNPFAYGCPGFLSTDTLYTTTTGTGIDPTYLSIDAGTVVSAGEKDRVFQVIFQKQIWLSPPGLFPQEIEFVAELSLTIPSTGAQEIHRITTDRLQMMYDATGNIDFTTSTSAPAIPPDPKYLEEATTPVCSAATACTAAAANCPTVFKDLLLCRQIPADIATPAIADSDKIKACVNVVFQQSTGNDFFMSVELNSGTGCAGIKTKQIVFQVMERDTSNLIQVVGEWDLATSADLVPGKCKVASSTSTALQPDSIVEHCVTAKTDKQLLHNYKNIGTEMFCGKWTYKAAGAITREFQAGIKFFYEDAGTEYKYNYRHSTIYEATGTAPAITIEKMELDANDRVDILWDKSPPTLSNTITIPNFRKTYMCECVTPRRDVATGTGIVTDPNLDIITLPMAGDPLDGCFEFNIKFCPGSLTMEKLGAQFIQKPCATSPNAKTLDISFVALNEKGFAYGELEVNRLIRPCYVPPSDVLMDKPIIHDQQPVIYTCMGLSPSDTLYSTDPGWISINADFEVPAGDPNRVVQIMFKNRIYQNAPAVYPKEIQFVAEISVDIGGTTEIRRIMTQRTELVFTASGDLDFPSSRPKTPQIKPDPSYLQAPSPLTCPMSPTPCLVGLGPNLCPQLNADDFLCRPIPADIPSPGLPEANAILPCLKLLFNYVFNDEFFISMELNPGITGCNNFQILQSVFMVIERDADGFQPAGIFSIAQSSDFVLNKCTDGSPSSLGLEPGLSRSLDSCSGPGGTDNDLYHNYKFSDKMICAKWTYSTGSTAGPHEVQAGVKLHYLDTSASTEHKFTYRFPIIYEITGSVPSLKVEKVVMDVNDRTDIYWSPPSVPPPPVIQIPLYRKTFMCECVTPRRDVATGTTGIITDPTLDIITLPMAGDPLDGCFEFTMVSCPGSLTQEKLGAQFIQKPCTTSPKTLDIYFIALNENGFAYGELEVNRLTRPCFNLPSDASDVIPIIHDQQPVNYTCMGLSPSDTLSTTDPGWISINADFEVPTGDPNRVVQIMLINRIYQAGAAFPKEIQFVAEFSVDIGGTTEIRRIMTKRKALAFTASGDVDFPSSSNKIPQIQPNDLYLQAASPLTCPMPPTPCPAGLGMGQCPKLNPDDFLCRQVPADVNTAVTPSDKIIGCMNFLFNYAKFVGANDFYLSMEINVAKTGCSYYKILQSVFQVVERDEYGEVRAIGTFEEAPMADFALKRCKEASSVSTSMKPFLTHSITYCDPLMPKTDKRLYHIYQDIGAEMICAKFVYSSPSRSTNPREFQANVKLHYEDTTTSDQYKYSYRIPTIYEVTGTGASQTIVKLDFKSSNSRIDILWDTTTSFATPAPMYELKVPEFRKTHMCHCLDFRRYLGFNPVDCNKDIQDLIPPDPTDVLKDCYEFKLVYCPGSLTVEKLGAIFIQKPCPGDPNIKTVDISFVTLNEKGYVYGELEVNQLVRPCFEKSGGPDGATSHLPVIHYHHSVSYACDDAQFPKTETLYSNPLKLPSWLSMDANLQVPAGGKPRAVQVMLKEKIYQGPNPYPNKLHMVAEFSVELTGGTVEIRRIKTKAVELTFTGGGDIDWASSTTLTPPYIPTSIDYLTEPAGIKAIPSTCKCSPCPTCAKCADCDLVYDPTVFLCRQIPADNPAPGLPETAAVLPCLKTLFNYDSGNEFFVSMELNPGGTGCGNFKIIQSVFTVLERDSLGIRVSGTFGMAQSSDFIVDKCTDGSPSSADLEPGLSKSLDACVATNAKTKPNLYHNYQFTDKMICAKWNYHTISTARGPHEVQAGVKLHYMDISASTEHKLTYRFPIIYELTGSGSSTKVEKVAIDANDRTDIYWDTNNIPTYIPQPEIKIPEYRKTYMCKCLSTRRVNPPTISTNPNSVIPDLIPPNPADSLDGCFEFNLQFCPESLTKEKLGAVFIQKPCTKAPNVKVVDISFIALNENGYPYGELEVNKLVRPCFSAAGGATGVLAYLPVIHQQDPVEYPCNNPKLNRKDTLYKNDPSWLSINADFLVFAGGKPRAVQVMFKEDIFDGGSHPKEIQMVAEFSVEISVGNYEIRRIITERRQLAFTGSGDLDWGSTTSITPYIDANKDYLTESSPLSCMHAPDPCSATNCQPQQPPEIFVCRRISADAASKPYSATIEPCLRGLFTHQAGSNDFFVSLEIDTSVTGCTGLDILESVFMVAERNTMGVKSVGTWDKTTSGDFTNGRCKDALSKATVLQTSLKYSIEHCDRSSGDQQLYHNYKPVGNNMICGKYTYSSKTTTVHELQAGAKIHYTDGTNEFIYTYRIPAMYDVSGSTIEKISEDPNLRTDIFWDMAPPQLTDIELELPVPRTSHMCECRYPPRHDNVAIPPPPAATYTIEDTFPAALMPCFDFKFANCPDSHSEELLGATFVLKSVSQGCTKGVQLKDISVVAINENGFPYGEIVLNQETKVCFDAGNPFADISKYKPVVNNMEPVVYPCIDDPKNLYPSPKVPKWISINAQVESEDNPFTGYQGTIFQFILKEKVKTAGGTPPTHLQFIAEFGVVESPGAAYQIYRKRTEQREIKYITSTPNTDKVNFATSTIVGTDITLHNDYLDEKGGVSCPKGSTPTLPPEIMPGLQDFMCQCVDKCQPPCAAPDPDIEKCFDIVLNHVATPTFPTFYMGLKKVAGSPCPDPAIVIHDVLFTAFSRKLGSLAGQLVGEWTVVDDLDYPQFITASSCVNTASPSLKPQRSSRFSIKTCVPKTGSSHSDGLFWHYRDLDDADKIMCAKLTINSIPPSKWEIQAGYRIIYSSGGGTVKAYQGMFPKIFRMDSSKNIEIIYEQENKFVDILNYVEFGQTCFLTPYRRESEMCECHNPIQPMPPSIPRPVPFAELKGTPLEPCFEFKMADCRDFHTKQNLGALFIQKGEQCGKTGLRVYDLAIIAVNEDGYPYGEIEVNLASAECLENTGPDSVLDYRPIVNFMNPFSRTCRSIYKEADRSKYCEKGFDPCQPLQPHWISIRVEAESDLLGPTPVPPWIIQVMLKEEMDAKNKPTSLQFIAEFTMEESPGSGVVGYRVASEHRMLTVTGSGRINFASSGPITTIPRVELHPDYIDTDIQPTPATCLPAPGLPEPAPNMKWTTCDCFVFEREPKESTPANPGQIAALKECLSLSFIHDASVTTPTTFYFSVAKLSPTPGKSCTNIHIVQFVLTALGRKNDGTVATISTDGVWSTANIGTDYVPGKCLPTGATVASYFPQKTSKRSVRGCADDNPAGPTQSLFFYYRYLRRDGDVNCGKFEFHGSLALREIQILYKIHFYDTANPTDKWHYNERFPLVFEYNSRTTSPISKEEIPNLRMELLHTVDPIINKGNCLDTPFVPTSDVCDCTTTRHGGFNQIPDLTLTEELPLAVPPIQLDCFDFKMYPCTLDGEVYDTIGAVLIINTPTSTPTPCTADILVEDASFVAINENGFPFGEPKFKNFHRVCFQPADIFQYKIKKMDFANPVWGLCDSRKKPGGGKFSTEYLFGGQIPSWLQVNVNADVPRLEKPIAIQVYLEKPPGGTSASSVQFIVEMVIMDRTSGMREMYKLKTQVYDIGYLASGHFDPAKLLPKTGALDIDRSDDWYETDDKNRVCHQPPPPIFSKKAAVIQQCACLQFTDGIPGSSPPLGSLLDYTAPLYTNNVEKCIFYEFWSDVDPVAFGPQKDVFFYLTIWTKTTAEEAACGDFQVVGMTLTPLIQENTPGNSEQKGVPFGGWHRTTISAPGFVMSNSNVNYTRGTQCKKNPAYMGGLRRLPGDYSRDCSKFASPVGDHRLHLFYYPMMNQEDNRNAYCASLKIDELGSGLDRFEFQIVGYLLMEFTTPPMKYYTIRRTFVFEYFEKGIPPPTPAPPIGPADIIFPGRVFEVQEESQDPGNCEVDICMYDT